MQVHVELTKSEYSGGLCQCQFSGCDILLFSSIRCYHWGNWGKSLFNFITFSLRKFYRIYNFLKEKVTKKIKFCDRILGSIYQLTRVGTKDKSSLPSLIWWGRKIKQRQASKLKISVCDADGTGFDTKQSYV